MKYAIILTGSFGDVINATPIAAELKFRSKDNIIHWFVSTRYTSALKLNPYVDKIIPIEAPTKLQSTIHATEVALKQAIGYDKVVTPAPYYNPYWNSQKYFIIDCIKKVAEETLDIKEWHVPWIPILKLSDQEIINARRFINNLPSKPKLLFEYQAESGQSYLTSQWVKPICDLFKDFTVILSGKSPQFTLPKNAVDGSVLSVRETAEAYKYVDFVVGVSSGITCICSSTWTNGINKPWVESCNNKLWSSANFPNRNRHICYSPHLNDFLNLLRKVKNG